MSTPDPAVPRPVVSARDLLAAILEEAPGAEVLAALRPEVLAHTREAYSALYRTPQALPTAVLHDLAAATAQWQGSATLAEHHSALAGGDAGTAEVLRDHVDALSISPSQLTHADQERLAAAGISPTVTVLISQLVSFESYLQRLIAGLAALHGAEVPAIPAPDRAPVTRGRGLTPAATTRTGRTRPQHFTRDQLQWEPWIPVPAEDELTQEQRDSFAAKATTNSVYFRMLSLTPAVTAARSALDNAIFLPRDGLPKAERELAAAVTSKVNDCIYCASVHARKAAMMSKRTGDVDALLAAELARDEDWISADLTPLSAQQSERWAVLIDAAAELSRPRPALRPEHIAALRALHLPDEQIADLLAAAAFFAWANRLMLSLGEPSLPDVEPATA